MALLHVLPSDGDATVEVYRRAAWLVASQDPATRTAYLELVARASGAAELGDSLAALAVDRPWRPVWVRAVAKRPSRIVGQDPGGIQAMGLLNIKSRPVLASLGIDGGIQLWDLRTRTAMGDPIFIGESGMSCLAAGTLHGRPVLLVSDGVQLLLIDVATREMLASLPTGDDALVSAVTLHSDTDRDVAVIGQDDGTIQVFDLRERLRVGQWGGHSGPVFALAAWTVNDALEVLSGGADGTATLWHLSPDGTDNIAETVHQVEGWINTVHLFAGPDGNILAVGASDGSVFVAHDATGSFTGSVFTAHDSAAEGYDTLWLGSDDQHYFTRATGGRVATYNDVIAAERKLDDNEGPRRYVGMRGGVNGVAAAWIDGLPILATCGHDGLVRLMRLTPTITDVWDVGSAEEAMGPVVLTHIDDRPRLLCGESGQHGAVVEWELRPGADPLPPEVGDLPGPVTALAVSGPASGPTQRSSTVAAAIGLQTVLGWDARRADTVAGSFDTRGLDIADLAVLPSNGANLLVAVGRSRRGGALRVWELAGKIIADIAIDGLAAAQALAITDAEAMKLIVGGHPWRGNDNLWRLTRRVGTRWGSRALRWGATPIRCPNWPDHLSFYKERTPEVVALSSLRTDVGTCAIACYGDSWSVWLLAEQADRPPTLAYLFSWTAMPTLARWDGKPILLVGEGDKLQSRRLDGDTLDDHPVSQLSLDPLPLEITAVAAIDVDRLLAVGGADGTVRVWRGVNHDAYRVVHIGTAVRKLLVADADTVVAATEDMVMSLRLG